MVTGWTKIHGMEQNPWLGDAPTAPFQWVLDAPWLLPALLPPPAAAFPLLPLGRSQAQRRRRLSHLWDGATPVSPARKQYQGAIRPGQNALMKPGLSVVLGIRLAGIPCKSSFLRAFPRRFYQAQIRVEIVGLGSSWEKGWSGMPFPCLRYECGQLFLGREKLLFALMLLWKWQTGAGHPDLARMSPKPSNTNPLTRAGAWTLLTRSIMESQNHGIGSGWKAPSSPSHSNPCRGRDALAVAQP